MGVRLNKGIDNIFSFWQRNEYFRLFNIISMISTPLSDDYVWCNLIY